MRYLSTLFVAPMRRPTAFPCLHLQSTRRRVSTIDVCPRPTFKCATTPTDLEIDRRNPLANTMAPYNQHIVIATGHAAWPSRIEEDVQPFVRQIKEIAGRAARRTDQRERSLITACNFAPSAAAQESDSQLASVYLFPAFKYFSTLSASPEHVSAFVSSYVLCKSASGTLTVLPSGIPVTMKFQPITDLIILICGHKSRDHRCGMMGPLLQSEFARQLRQLDIAVVQGNEKHALAETHSSVHDINVVRVGLTSHVGGHKFAGNVIIYVPPTLQDSELRGKGIWYGRVEPKHVEGIIKETIIGGRVIKELFRGGITAEGEKLCI